MDYAPHAANFTWTSAVQVKLFPANLFTARSLPSAQKNPDTAVICDIRGNPAKSNLARRAA
jgi:hypothetical protein